MTSSQSAFGLEKGDEMILAVPFAIVGPWLAGYLLSGVLRTGSASARLPPMLRASLGLGWGLGLASCVYFVWRASGGPAGVAYVGIDVALFAILAAVGYFWGRVSRVGTELARQERGLPRWFFALLAIAVAGSIGLAVVNFALLVRGCPHGSWDALAIWNLRARFLDLGLISKAETFHPALISSHLDYPLLIPSTVARFWSYGQGESMLAPNLVAAVFCVALIGLFFSALTALRSRSQACLGCLALLASASVVRHGAMQYADIPLAYFMLATVVAFAMGDRAETRRGSIAWALVSGMMAGFAAWTKNEGIVFLGAVFVTRFGPIIGSRRRREVVRQVLAFSIGLAPIFAVLAVFKFRFTPPNDYLAAQTLAEMVAKITDGSRYRTVAKAVYPELSRLASGAIAWLFVYRILLGGAPRRSGAGVAWDVLGLMIFGYLMAYITTPLFLPWHLEWSLDRLIMHLWPLGVFAVFLSTATPEEALQGKPKGLAKVPSPIAEPERAADDASSQPPSSRAS